MTAGPERGLRELYADPERADFELWGRRTTAGTDRRGFLKGAGLAAMERFLRAGVPMARHLPAGLIPVPLAGAAQSLALPGKSGLIVLSDRPIGAECPAHLLDDPVTPVERLFVRNNGLPPPVVRSGADDWTVEIAGEACVSPRTFSLRELQTGFRARTYQLQLECAGNGRSKFFPPAPGMQWTTGAIGWPPVDGRTRARRAGALRDRRGCRLCGFRGLRPPSFGTRTRCRSPAACRCTRPWRTSRCWRGRSTAGRFRTCTDSRCALYSADGPVRASGKWIRRILIRDRVHDGEKMLGRSYRVPCEPVAPGDDVPDANMCIIDAMPVKSLITFPMSGAEHPVGERLPARGHACLNASRIVETPCAWGQPLDVRGHAWAGDAEVAEVRTSIDFGATWQRTHLEPPANRLAWQRWSTRIGVPVRGYYEIWARAVDAHGRSQPMIVPGWNPRGYLNNACHRIAVRAV